MANVKTSSYYILENTIHNQQNSLPPSPTTHTQFSLHPWGEGHEDHNFSYLLPTEQHFVLICSVVFNKNIFIFYTDNVIYSRISQGGSEQVQMPWTHSRLVWWLQTVSIQPLTTVQSSALSAPVKNKTFIVGETLCKISTLFGNISFLRGKLSCNCLELRSQLYKSQQNKPFQSTFNVQSPITM